MNINAVARELGISGRSLHRDLVDWTGMRPKMLARIFRSQRALARIRSGRMALIDIAQETGYADQAHMTRDLGRLTGVRPSEFLARV